MKSDDEILNEKQFMDLLAKVRPDLWGIEVYRQELGFVDLGWVKNVMRGVFNIALGMGCGETIIEIRNKKLIRIRSTETDHLDKSLFP